MAQEVSAARDTRARHMWRASCATGSKAHLALSTVTLSTVTVAKKSPELIRIVGMRIFRETALEMATLWRSTSTFSTAVSVGRFGTRHCFGGGVAVVGAAAAAFSGFFGRAGP